MSEVKNLPMAPRRSVIANGMLAALIGGLCSVFLGMVVITCFGLLAFAKEWAGNLVAFVGLPLLIPNVFVFLPVSSIFAVLFCSLRLRREGMIRIASACLLAIVLLSGFSAVVTFFVMQKGEQLKTEADAQWVAKEQVTASVVLVRKLLVQQDQEQLHVSARWEGNLDGLYQATVIVRDSGKKLYEDTWQQRYPWTKITIDHEIPLSSLREGYRRELLEGNQKVLVESTFAVEFGLELITPDDASVNDYLPSVSPDRRSTVRENIKLDLGEV